MAHDIVYLLRNGVDSEELRYSLRSVQANFPYNKVWFVGGCPKDITPDVYIPMKQQGNTKWARSTSSLKAVCEVESLTEDFWLFNDDFFVLEPVNGLPYMYKGLLADRQPINSTYMRMLKVTEDQLTKAGLPTLDYAIHVPMLINKQKAQILFQRFPYNPMFRCLYVNYWQVGGERVSDVKIYDRLTLPAKGQSLCSTVDEIFRFGAVGRYIKEQFKKPSKWEGRK